MKFSSVFYLDYIKKSFDCFALRMTSLIQTVYLYTIICQCHPEREAVEGFLSCIVEILSG